MTWGGHDKRRKEGSRRVMRVPDDPAQRVVDLECDGQARQACDALDALHQHSPEDARRAMAMSSACRMLRQPVPAPDFTDAVLQRLEREQLLELDSPASSTPVARVRRTRRRWTVSPTLAAVLLGAAATITLMLIRTGKPFERTRASVPPSPMALSAEAAQERTTMPLPPSPLRLSLGDTSTYDRLTPVSPQIIRFDDHFSSWDWPELGMETKLTVSTDREPLRSPYDGVIDLPSKRAWKPDWVPATRTGLFRLPVTPNRLDVPEEVRSLSTPK